MSPRQFLLSFFDLREGRRCWEPSYAQGAVLEEIDVPEEEGSVMLATPRCLKRGRRDKGPGQSSMESPPMPGGERATGKGDWEYTRAKINVNGGRSHMGSE